MARFHAAHTTVIVMVSPSCTDSMLFDLEVTLKSGLEVTHTVNLCMICTLLKPAAVFLRLILIVWVCLHSLVYSELWKEAMVRSLEIIEIAANRIAHM